MSQSSGIKVVARNRKASHEYELLDTYEAGLVLTGSEVKSILAGNVNIREAFVRDLNGELWVLNMHVSEYKQASHYAHEPLRPRKLLLNKKEIYRIMTTVAQKGYTIVPTQIYFRNRRAKMEIALARGKKLHDKRENIRERDDKRQIERLLKNR